MIYQVWHGYSITFFEAADYEKARDFAQEKNGVLVRRIGDILDGSATYEYIETGA